VSSEVTIYSIVNSLVELDNVNKVQILVNGESEISYRESISLTVTYTASDEVVLIKAFVVETGTFVPVCSAWEKAFDS